MTLRHLTIFATCLAASSVLGQDSQPPSSEQLTAEYREAQDVREIRRHVESIFEAFIAADYDTVRATHTEDWRGVRVPNPQLVRTIDGYMAGVNPGAGNPPLGYDFLEIDIDVHGDYASILYMARYFREGSDGDVFTYLLRSIDTYRRDPEGWNQCGSVIRPLMDFPARVPSIRELIEFWPPSALAATRRGGEALESPRKPLEPVDPAIAKMAQRMIEALEGADDAALDELLTREWKGYGVTSTSIESHGSNPSGLTRALLGEAEVRGLELLDVETQVRGAAGAMFCVAKCRARRSPDEPEVVAWLAIGAMLRQEKGQWRQSATHLALIPLVEEADSRSE